MDQIVELDKCGLCESDGLETISDLPKFPLTGIFLKQRNPDIPKGFDQALNMCGECGHLQLAKVLPPPVLYGDGYSHRSSASHLSSSASDSFIDYIDQLAPGRRFNCILEIGCNDLVLLSKLSKKGKQVFGIDPIWIDKSPEPPANATIIGGYVEDVDIQAELGSKPDLIVSTHNLEHIVDPLALLKRLLDLIADDGLLVIEVPDSDCLLRHRRFDQIFHQHVHYLGLDTFLKLIKAAGGRYLGHSYNYANWGGSFSVAFARDGESDEMPQARAPSITEVAANYEAFREQMSRFGDLIGGVDFPLVGYGAGQMVPAVAYHLGSDLGFLECIYDDDQNRNGLYYPHITPSIKTPSKDLFLGNRGVVITALDGVRAITNRLREAAPRFIYVPTSVY